MSIWSIWFNQTNETDQINERDQLQRGQWMAQRMPQDRKSAVILIAEDDREMRSLLCD